MRVLHYATRPAATIALIAFAAGCSGDSTAPSAPFDPAGTSADLAAIDHSFDAPALESFSAASTGIQAVVGGTLAAAVAAMPSAAIVRDGKSGALRYGASLSRTYGTGGLRPSLSAAAIPAEYQGVTFVYDVDTDTYVPSELPGAPSAGVRFLLYAVNSVTGQPIEPLVEVGYADITSSETATSATVRVVVVSAGVTYLDYGVLATAGVSSITVTITGFATNGDDRVDYDLKTTLTGENGGGLGVALDYLLTVPTRGGFRLDIESATTGLYTESTVSTVDLRARGPHGTVSIQGSETNSSGTFDVDVNGELFATITTSAGALPLLTGADGEPLTQAEQDVFWAIWAMFVQGLDFFEDVIDPVF